MINIGNNDQLAYFKYPPASDMALGSWPSMPNMLCDCSKKTSNIELNSKATHMPWRKERRTAVKSFAPMACATSGDTAPTMPMPKTKNVK